MRRGPFFIPNNCSKVSLEAEEAVEAEDDFITLQVGCTLYSQNVVQEKMFSWSNNLDIFFSTFCPVAE